MGSAEAATESDLRREGVLALSERLNADGEHGRRVAELAGELFDGARKLHGLGPNQRELLEHAALLHDVGAHVSYAKHHRHSYYLIAHSELVGFLPEETRLIATIARFHRGAAPKPSHKDLAGLGPEAREVVLPLTAILRVADGLDRSHQGRVRSVRVSRYRHGLEVELDTGGREAMLELWNARHKADLWERTFDLALRFKIRGASMQRLAG